MEGSLYGFLSDVVGGSASSEVLSIGAVVLAIVVSVIFIDLIYRIFSHLWH